jgi:hypothetical protein
MNQIRNIVALLLIGSFSMGCAAQNKVCQEINQRAQRLQAKISGDQSGMLVVGQTQVPIYDAPDSRCKSKEQQLSPGMRVDTFAEIDGFLGILYIEKESAKEIIGWVKSDRLERTGTGIAPSYR